jgi:hypothetical protein
MKKIAFLAVAAIMATLRVGAWEATTTEMNFRQLAEPKLTVPTMELKSNYGPTSYYYRPELELRLEDHKPWAKENWTWMRSNEGVKPYKFMDDITFAGIPVFAAGWLIKGEKASFRQDYKNKHSNTRLITNFKTGIDDYTQFFGPALTVGLKAGGYEGRSDWGRLLGSSLMSYAIMAGFVNGIKYTASEMRPDGSTANSWPSGHTATSFVGATILHKEYGLTRSPWFSVAGYGMATATGVMRILNNRHWISDVLSGAGIGIMSTELGYALGDLLFKDRGLLRNDLQNFSENPSFFAISMGLSFGSKSLGFNDENLVTNLDDQFDDDEEDEQVDIDFHTATSVDAEGAYFFNKYIGIGGRLRVRAMTAKGWSNFIGWAHEDRDLFVDYVKGMYQLFPSSTSMKTNEEIDRELSDIITDEEITVESDHLTEFSANVGLYLNLPLSNRFALGTKFLIGRTMTQELDINAAYKGTVKRMDTHIVIDNNEVQDLSISNLRNGDKYDVEWDYLTLGGNNSTTYGTGLSLTYKHKSNFMWRVFVDYDYSKKEFELTYDPLRFLKLTTPDLSALFTTMNTSLDPYIYKKEKKMHYFTIGASFAISF